MKGHDDAIAKLDEARAIGDHAAIFLNEKNLAFHLGGGDKPTGDLAAAIDYVKVF